MVHADNDIVPPTDRLTEHRVCWRGFSVWNADALGQRRIDRRLDLIYFLPAEQAILTTMGIQTRNSDFGGLDSQGSAPIVGDADAIQHAVFLHPVASLPQRDVRGNVHHPQIFVGQHHGVLFSACKMGVNLRMPAEMMPRHVDSLFAQRIGDSGIHLTFHGQLNDLFYILKSRFATQRAGDSELSVRNVGHNA